MSSENNKQMLLIFIFSCCLWSTALSHKLHLQLLEYEHLSNKLSNGKPCDEGRSPCDPRFIICLKTEKSQKLCNLLNGSTPRGYFTDKSFIAFERKFGEMENLFTAILPVNQSSLVSQIVTPYLSIQAHDDENVINSIGYFNTILKDPGEYKLSPSRTTQSPLSYIKIRYWFTCSDNWFGEKCDKYCVPDGNSSAHYGCDTSRGEKVCERGFKKSIENRLICEEDPCHLNVPCKFSSECVNIRATIIDPNPYRCKCPQHLRGSHCEEVKKPCPVEICFNGGKCWVDENETAHCQCPPQFTGSVCDKVIYSDVESMHNQCNGGSDSTPLCHNNGKCMPKPFVGSDTCFCPSGFGGERCELNVIWSSSYDEMILWRDLARKYIDFVSASLTPILTTRIHNNPNNQAIIQTFHKSVDLSNAKEEYSIKKMHFGLIVLALACLATLVFVVGMLVMCRRRRNKAILEYIRTARSVTIPEYVRNDSPISPSDNYYPVIFLPPRSPITMTDSLNTTLATHHYTWNVTEDDYLAPDTVYETLDDVSVH